MRSSFLSLVTISVLIPVQPVAGGTSHGPQATATSQSSQQSAPTLVPEFCPATKPPALPFVPPAPYPDKAGPNSFWIGTNQLWIGLRRDGTWASLPHWPDGTYRQKLFWWQQGYTWRRDPQPPLKVTGKRLDSPAPPIQSEVSHGWTGDDPDHPFIVNGINLTGLGCWEITGRLDDAELRFVVWVTR